jgi:hypothetical protein
VRQAQVCLQEPHGSRRERGDSPQEPHGFQREQDGLRLEPHDSRLELDDWWLAPDDSPPESDDSQQLRDDPRVVPYGLQREPGDSPPEPDGSGRPRVPHDSGKPPGGLPRQGHYGLQQRGGSLPH